jgi:hypothetical protein
MGQVGHLYQRGAAAGVHHAAGAQKGLQRQGAHGGALGVVQRRVGMGAQVVLRVSAPTLTAQPGPRVLVQCRSRGVSPGYTGVPGAGRGRCPKGEAWGIIPRAPVA